MKVKVIVLVGILLISLSVFLTTRTTSQNKSKRYIVKLYSGDKVMVSWDARDIGRVEGESLVFSVGKDNNSGKVRICGTYSVEESE
jgi:hypothetical protein